MHGHTAHINPATEPAIAAAPVETTPDVDANMINDRWDGASSVGINEGSSQVGASSTDAEEKILPHAGGKEAEVAVAQKVRKKSKTVEKVKGDWLEDATEDFLLMGIREIDGHE